jgi:Spy/CpxP family protein refolding chaperone
MKKQAIVLSVIVGFLLLPLWPLAAQEEPGPAPAPRMGPAPQLFKWLDLTPEQQAKLKDMRKAHEESMKGLREQQMKMGQEMKNLLADPKADQKKVDGLIDEMAKLQATRMKANIRFRQDMEKVFTPQQLEKIKKARSAFQGRGRLRMFMRHHPGARRFMERMFFGRQGFNRPWGMGMGMGMGFRRPGLWNRMFWEW